MSIIFTKIEAAPIGENTYVIKDESTGKCAVIDPGCMTASINRFIYDGSGLEYILLTHAHWDHIAALNEYVSKYPDARVVASFDEREMLIDSSINHSARYTESAISREADIYVSDNEELSEIPSLDLSQPPDIQKAGCASSLTISFLVEIHCFSGV